jgi:CheY-like chemotaxis protein
MIKKAKILIIEDQPQVRKTIRETLSGLNYDFIETDSGEDGLEKIKQDFHDVIILDLKLPGIDGIETFKQALKIRQDLGQVIVLTGYADHISSMKTTRLGVFNYLTKTPLNPTELRETVIRASNIESLFDNYRIKPCFKHHVVECLGQFPPKKNLVFVGMPFSIPDIYEHAISPVIKSFGLEPYRADDDKQGGDLSCKICANLQYARFSVLEISELNPNVFIEVGLAYAYGKPVILLKKKNSAPLPVNIGNIEYVEYTDINSLKKNLEDRMKTLLFIHQ